MNLFRSGAGVAPAAARRAACHAVRHAARRVALPRAVLASGLLAATLSAPAQAYVGPGAGLGVIGTLFGIVAAIVLALFGLFWYPLKRAFGKKKSGATDAPAADPTLRSDAEPAVGTDTGAVATPDPQATTPGETGTARPAAPGGDGDAR